MALFVLNSTDAVDSILPMVPVQVDLRGLIEAINYRFETINDNICTQNATMAVMEVMINANISAQNAKMDTMEVKMNANIAALNAKMDATIVKMKSIKKSIKSMNDALTAIKEYSPKGVKWSAVPLPC